MKDKQLHTDLRNPSLRSLFEWEADERYWVPKERQWYVLYSFFFLSLITFLFLIGEYLFVLGVIAFAFLWFIQGSIPPQKTKHIITSLGIKAFEKLNRWEDVDYFWFTTKDNAHFLNLDIFSEKRNSTPFRKRTSLLINTEDLDELFEIMIKYVKYGDKDDTDYSIFTKMLYGEYVEITTFMIDTEASTRLDASKVSTQSQESDHPKKPMAI